MDTMKLTRKQIETKEKIEKLASLFGIDTAWAVAIAMIESSLGINQKSPTGCRGVFQMSTIAMKDLLLSMEQINDDIVDIACGILFLRLLLKRHGSMEKATRHFCTPDDRDFYLEKVKMYQLMEPGMDNEYLEERMEKNGLVEIAHVVRNDIVVVRQLLREATRNPEQVIEYIEKADHRLQGTEQSLQLLIDRARKK